MWKIEKELQELENLDLDRKLEQVMKLRTQSAVGHALFRTMDLIVQKYGSWTERRSDDVYSTRFFTRYRAEINKLKQLVDIIEEKRETYNEVPELKEDFFELLSTVEPRNSNQKYILDCLNGNFGQEWDKRLVKAMNAVDKVGEKDFLKRVSNDLKALYNDDRFQNSYIGDLLETLVESMQEQSKAIRRTG